MNAMNDLFFFFFNEDKEFNLIYNNKYYSNFG